MLNCYPSINRIVTEVCKQINQLKTTDTNDIGQDELSKQIITSIQNKTDGQQDVLLNQNLSLNQSFTSIYQVEQPNQQLQIMVKYAKLKSAADEQYKSYQQHSHRQIVVLPSRISSKKYKIHVCATSDEYQQLIKNCQKSTQYTKSKQNIKIQLRFNQENIFKIIGDNSWNLFYKNQYQSKKYKILIAGKEFRIDLNHSKLEDKLGKLGFNQKINLKLMNLSQCSCIRILQNRYFYLSQHFEIICSKLIQIEQKQQKQQLFQIINKNIESEIDKFILNNLPSNNRQLIKYELKLKIPIKGKIKQIGKIPQLMNTYLGFIIESLYGLQKQQFDDILEWQFFNYVNLLQKTQNNMNKY